MRDGGGRKKKERTGAVFRNGKEKKKEADGLSRKAGREAKMLSKAGAKQQESSCTACTDRLEGGGMKGGDE